MGVRLRNFQKLCRPNVSDWVTLAPLARGKGRPDRVWSLAVKPSSRFFYYSLPTAGSLALQLDLKNCFLVSFSIQWKFLLFFFLSFARIKTKLRVEDDCIVKYLLQMRVTGDMIIIICKSKARQRNIFYRIP